MELKIGNTAELISKSQAIRHQVFVIEQNIPLELDLDGLDECSYHAVMTDGDFLIATARLYSVDGNHSVMARIAVVKEYRGSKVATKLINALISYAHEKNISTIEIHAHEYLREYYERFGFEFIQKVEIVGEHQLIEMRCNIKNT